MTDPILECREVSVAYGRTIVVRDVDLEVGAGDTLALLGPSGSGKTTVLSAVAGFLALAAGEIRLRGRMVADRDRSEPPERRNVGVVFQHAALWPHLSALETVAYPLRRRGVDRREAIAEAARLLDLMGMTSLAERRPSELSGGEQQRVGLARALARQPDLFLFDEPTAHLDTPLRTALQDELAERRAATGAAAVLATHDVGEAMAIADRVALIRNGCVVQVGAPAVVYEMPVDEWAAELTGPASMLDLEIVGRSDGAAEALVAGVRVRVAWSSAKEGRVRALVRPDWATLDGPLAGTVESVRFRGPHTEYRVATDAGRVHLRSAGLPRAVPGEAVGWSLLRAWPFSAD